MKHAGTTSEQRRRCKPQGQKTNLAAVHGIKFIKASIKRLVLSDACTMEYFRILKGNTEQNKTRNPTQTVYNFVVGSLGFVLVFY